MKTTAPGSGVLTSRGAACAVLAAVLLTSCGGASEGTDPFLDQSPRAITKTAFAEMGSVTSARLLGTMPSTSGRARIDVRVDDEGRCAGSFDTDRGQAMFIHTAEGSWIKPDETFWRTTTATSQQARRAMAEVGTSWAKVGPEAAAFDEFCDLPGMLTGIKARKDGGDGRLSKGDVEVIGETRAIAIREKGRGQASTAWVAIEAPHRVVKIDSREMGRSMSISFEEFGLDVDAEAPAADEVVDMSAYAMGRTPRG